MFSAHLRLLRWRVESGSIFGRIWSQNHICYGWGLSSRERLFILQETYIIKGNQDNSNCLGMTTILLSGVSRDMSVVVPRVAYGTTPKGVFFTYSSVQKHLCLLPTGCEKLIPTCTGCPTLKSRRLAMRCTRSPKSPLMSGGRRKTIPKIPLSYSLLKKGGLVFSYALS